MPASYAGNEAADRYKKFVEESPALRHYAEMLRKQEQDAATLQWIQNIFNSVPAGQNATITPNADGSGYYYESMTSYVDTDGQVTVESRMNFVAQQRSANVILNFSNESFTLRGGSGWDLRSVCSMEEATKYLNSLNSAGRKINNLVLIGHGNYEHITLGDNGIIVSNRSGGITTPETLNKLNHILTEVSIGGNVLIVGCKAGGIFGANGSSSYQNISLNINGTFNFIK